MTSAPILTFFNNKGGVGKTSLVYHLGWMLSKMRKRVLFVDLDPQANLTAALLAEGDIETLWQDVGHGNTIFDCVTPLSGVGDIRNPTLQKIADDLYLLPGDISLAKFEDTLSEVWPDSMNDSNLYRPLRILSSFWSVMCAAASQIAADIVLVDVGPHLGAINRSVLIATDFVAIPLAADLFSLQGLRNLGGALQSWKRLWSKRLSNWNENPESGSMPLELPAGRMMPIGYLCQQPSIRLDRPVKAYDKWIHRMPEVYHRSVLGEDDFVGDENDAELLATIKHYRSLIPMGQELRKPIFDLTPADGAAGSHAAAAHRAYDDFNALAQKIMAKVTCH